MSTETIQVPDIGTDEQVEVIEIYVSAGDEVGVEDELLALESDKASMDVPSPKAGRIREILVKVGDRVGTGTAIARIEAAGESAAAASDEPAPDRAEESAPAPDDEAPQAEKPDDTADASETVDIVVPDLGTDGVEVIELSVAAGDAVEEGDALLVMESDKASMDLPAPASGEIVELTIKVGDPIRSGDRIGLMKRRGAAPQPEGKPAAGGSAVPAESGEPAGASSQDAEPAIRPAEAPADAASGDIAAGISQLEKRQQARPETPALWAGRGEIYAGPAVRVLAKELGVDLGAVSGSGPKGRIVKEDVQQHVKTRLAAPAGSAGGGAIPPIPEVDFAAFGEIELQPMSGIQKATVTNMSRAWLNVPHVTQFDDADVTDLESFRAGLKPEMERRGVKLTPLPFLLKAAAIALREHPRFNSSLHADGEHVVMKKYFHVGIAVDTPRGLMVPVIRDVLDKTLWDLAAEARDLAGKARDRKLKPADMQGGCFTISSLGPIGGSGFTPIVNAPEVAILGVSRLAVKPVWTGEAFEPRKMLPLGLSYDHRQINGADAGAFMTFLCQLLGDIRRFVL